MRERRHLSDEELEALRDLLHGRKTQLGVVAALIAAGATALSAIVTSLVSLVELFRTPKGP